MPIKLITFVFEVILWTIVIKLITKLSVITWNSLKLAIAKMPRYALVAKTQ